MATVYKREGSTGRISPFWVACFYSPGPDARRMLVRLTTKIKDRKGAALLAGRLEDAGRLAEAGRLTPSKIEEVVDYAREMGAGVPGGGRVRGILDKMIENTGGEKLEERTAEGWMREWLSGKSGKDAKTAAKTVVRYTYVVDRFLDHLGDKRGRSVAWITTKDLRTFREKQRASGKAAVTVNLDMKIIASALRKACLKGYFKDNPAAALDPLTDDGGESRQPFTPEEVKALLAAATGEWKGAIIMGLFTGARLGDVVRMRWAAVDLAEGRIEFSPQKTSRKRKGNRLELPLHPDLAEYLLSLPAPDDGQAFIFPALAGRKGGGAHGLSCTFKKIMVRAGVAAGRVRTRTGPGGRNVSAKSFHSLRHACNSWLHNAGVSQELRQRILGHLSQEVNDGYTHTTRETLKTALGVLPSVKTPTPSK